MPPAGLAIIIGAGPNTGTGIARILSHPSHGNLAVALLARRAESLSTIKSHLQKTSPDSIIETFVSDTQPSNIASAFASIRAHASFANLKLKLAIYSIKHSSKKPFLEETHKDFTESLETYVGGAFAFAQESVRRLIEDYGNKGLEESGGEKKGTIIFTGTLGSLRSNEGYAAYGAGRAGVRQLAQSLAKEHSKTGIHVAHVIARMDIAGSPSYHSVVLLTSVTANGGIADEDTNDQKIGKKMSADAVGKTYLWLSQQEPTLWTHELDMRPALEKF